MTTDDPAIHSFVSRGVEETLAVGHRLGSALHPGAVIALVGQLGSGKTHLVKGIARGNKTPAGVIVNSPTFVIVNEYPGRIQLFHIDVYRLGGPSELEAIGFDEMCAAGGAVLVEWADRVLECLPADRLEITIELAGPTTRRLQLQATGPDSSALLRRLGRLDAG